MFKISVAHSLTAHVQTSAPALVERALHDLNGHSPQAALFFSTYGRDHAGMLAQLSQMLPGCPIVGGSSNGEVSHQQGYQVGSAVLILFASDTVRIHAGVLRNLSFDDADANARQAELVFQTLEQSVAGAPSPTNPQLGLLFPDGLGLDGESIVNLFGNHFPDTRFFGGACAENFQLQNTCQFFNTEVLHNAVAYLFFYGPLRFHWEITAGFGSGWQPVGARLTAQCEGKWIKTIEQQPATHYLETRYKLQGGLLSVCHPFVIYPSPDSDDYYFRDVFRYSDETGALEAVQQLPEQCQVQLTQPDAAAILDISSKTLLQTLAHFPGSTAPAGILWFSCVSRALVLQQDPASEFNAATRLLPPNLPIGGFYAYGEIAPTGSKGLSAYHSSTLVALALGEAPRVSTGVLSAGEQISTDNLAQEIAHLNAALADARNQINRLQGQLNETHALGRLAKHSKTEQNTYHRALALELICSVLDTHSTVFKRLAFKGDPPRLNRSGLARLINEQHLRQWGTPFPLTPAQLARLLGPEHADI